MVTPGCDEAPRTLRQGGLGDETEGELAATLAEPGGHEPEQHANPPGAARDVIYNGQPIAGSETPPRMMGCKVVPGSGPPSTTLTAIAKAALTGDFETFTTELRFMEDTLAQDELREVLTATSGRGEGSLMAAASKGGSPAVFSAVAGLLDGEVLRAVAQSWPLGRSVILDAANEGLTDFNAVVEILNKPLDIDEAMDAVSCNRSGGVESFFTGVAQRSSRHILQAWAEVLSATLPPELMAEACTTSFAACSTSPHCLHSLSVLFAYGAEFSTTDLIDLARLVSLDQLKTCFLGGLSLVDNPFPAGSKLSVAIDKALNRASPAEMRDLSDLQETLDDILVDVLERLPQTIADFPGGVNGFAVVFEPEIAGTRGIDYRGPVRLALGEIKWGQTFCSSPLIYEYMWHKFAAGLPNLRDTGNLLGKAAGTRSGGSPLEGRDFLYSTQMVANSRLGRKIQGSGLTRWGSEITRRPRGWDRIWGGTFLPGAQFIAVGVLTRPMSYYKVPALRMLLDFCAHLLVLTLYTTVALDNHELEVSVAETVLKFHIVAEFVQGFVKREWGWLGMSSIFLLAGATIANLVQSSGNAGRALFALSAPLLFARLLAFGKILKPQFTEIQAIGIMLKELVHFGLVLGVMIMGFSLAFFVLLDGETFGDAWFDSFKAMLGEAEVFEDYYEDELGGIAKLLVVVYLFVASILLLNLLIAALSTAHARLEEMEDRAFMRSTIRFITLYSGHVEKDSLPAPFSLIQLALWLPAVAVDRLFVRDGSRRLSTNTTRVVGVASFWLVLGPLGLVAGWALWVLSVPPRVGAVFRGAPSWWGAAWQILAVVVLHTICVPFIMLGLWIKSGGELLMHSLKNVVAVSLGGPVRGEAEIKSNPSSRYDVYERSRDSISVAQMLQQAPDGLSVQEIWRRVEETNRADERRERERPQEEQGRPATVADILEMRDHLESSSSKDCAAVVSRVESILTARLDALEETIKRSVAHGGR